MGVIYVKDLKTLLAGSAAVLLPMAVPVAVQAADLPSVKSAPVQYVRICDAYGAGFFFIPGTQTCLKIGGRVRFELSTQSNSNTFRHASTFAGSANAPKSGYLGPFTPDGGTAYYTGKNGKDSLSWLARGYLFVDARTQSAWGTVQAVMTLRVNSTSGFMAGNNTTGVFAATNGFGPTLDAAYVRFAGFTFGRASSNFTALPPYMYNTDYWGGFAAGIKQLAYTATFGGGFSASIALEDRHDMGSMVTANALGLNPNFNPLALPPAVANGGAITATAVGPSRLPNLVGNIRIDQAWGWAQLSGAVGQNTANVGGIFTNAAGGAAVAQPILQTTNGNGPLLKRTGWAIAGTVRINLPMIAAGDHLHLTAGYTNGMLDMIVGQAGVNGNAAKNGFYLGGLNRFDRSMTIFCTSQLAGPAAGCTTAGAETTKAWNVGGMFTHFWTPTVRQNFAASYVRVTPGRVTQNTDWAQGGLSKASAWTVGTNLIWSPVRGFDIGLELSYARAKQNITGNNGGLPSAVTIPGACPGNVAGCSPLAANFKVSPNVWNARLRVERNF